MFVGTASWMLQENPRKKQSGREKPTLTAPGSNAIPLFRWPRNMFSGLVPRFRAQNGL